MKKYNIVKEKKDFDKAFKERNQFKSKYFYVYLKRGGQNAVSNCTCRQCLARRNGCRA